MNFREKIKSKRERLHQWTEKKKEWIVATYIGFATVGMTTIPAWAVDLTTTTSEIRKQLTPVYYLALGLICIYQWARGRLAVAFTILFVGLFFGIILLSQTEAASLLTWLKETLF